VSYLTIAYLLGKNTKGETCSTPILLLVQARSTSWHWTRTSSHWA